MHHVTRRCGLGLERNLDPEGYLLLLLSDTCIGWRVKVMCGERNFHRQFHLLVFHPLLMIQMCECGRSLQQMVLIIDNMYLYT